MGRLVMFQQMGFGVAAALLLDATVVRAVLLPATMKLLGEWNWYLPRVLGRVPVPIAEEPAPPGPAMPVTDAGERDRPNAPARAFRLRRCPN